MNIKAHREKTFSCWLDVDKQPERSSGHIRKNQCLIPCRNCAQGDYFLVGWCQSEQSSLGAHNVSWKTPKDEYLCLFIKSLHCNLSPHAISLLAGRGSSAYKGIENYDHFQYEKPLFTKRMLKRLEKILNSDLYIAHHVYVHFNLLSSIKSW